MDLLEEVLQYSNNLKILYVEDDEFIRESTIEMLKEFFNNIIVAVDGEDGLNKFKENKNIDLIITDINMPKLNGLDMIKQIKKLDEDIFVIALSAHNEVDYFIKSIEYQIDGYLFKPFEIESFINTLSGIIKKIRALKESKKYLKFLNEYQEATNLASIVSKTDLKGIITYVNDKFCKISGYSKEELIGKPHNIIRHPNMPKEIFKDLWQTIKNKKVWQGIIRNRAKNGKSYYVDTTIKPILDIDGNIVEFIAIRNDITEIMNPKKQLEDAVKNEKNLLVAYMKLEDYDTLEELYDSETIELILEKVLKQIEQNLPINIPYERVFKLENGEYAFVLDSQKLSASIDEFLYSLNQFQEKIRHIYIKIKNIQYSISLIISIAYDGDDRLDSARLGIKELLKTKRNFIVANNFLQKKQDIAKKNMQTLTTVKKAIENYRIISYFQPIINNKTKKIEKYESLVRLVDENDKILSPFFFLDVAKKGGYYNEITKIVLNNSFNILNFTSMDISINISALDIESKEMRDVIIRLLDEYKNNAHRVVFELLEDEAVKDFKVIKDFITQIKSYGVKIAIDDFGAGYSNFERLLDYQPDILKIDGSLIKNIETDEFSLSIVKTIVSFAKEQNLQTVAEFVENENIYKILYNLGIDYSQGYYFGKPEPLNFGGK